MKTKHANFVMEILLILVIALAPIWTNILPLPAILKTFVAIGLLAVLASVAVVGVPLARVPARKGTDEDKTFICTLTLDIAAGSEEEAMELFEAAIEHKMWDNSAFDVVEVDEWQLEL